MEKIEWSEIFSFLYQERHIKTFKGIDSMKKKRATNFFESEEYKKLKGDTINLAVLNATTGVGYNSMRKKLNDLMEKTGANQSVGNKSETILQIPFDMRSVIPAICGHSFFKFFYGCKVNVLIRHLGQ